MRHRPARHVSVGWVLVVGWFLAGVLTVLESATDTPPVWPPPLPPLPSVYYDDPPPVARTTPTPRAARSRSHTTSVTAYCATGNRTASGVWPAVGMAAGNAWPFGTVLHVEGVGRVTVTDRIGHGSDLDLFAATCADAIVFGRRRLEVRVIR